MMLENYSLKEIKAHTDGMVGSTVEINIERI